MQKKYMYMAAAGTAILVLAVSAFFWKNWDETLPNVNLRTSDVPGTSDVQARPIVQNGVYQNKKFGFSVAIPERFKVTENNPDEFTTLVLAETANPAEKRSFQIFIMPFDEPGPINKERILIDMPNAVIDNPQSISINGIDAFLFFGKDEDLGRTREVWFVNNGYLYQVSSWASFDEELSKIMATFKFINR